jgi:hypothetical protein
MIRIRLAITIVACGFAVVACAKKPPAPPVSADVPATTDDVAARVSELRRKAQELTAAAQQLPGSVEEDRRLVAEAFARSSEALQLLAGPDPDGAFRQQIRIIDNTRTFLQSGMTKEVSADPSIDSGLRSIENALSNTHAQLFPGDDKIRPGLDALRMRIAELDTVRGPLHAAVVAQAFQSAAAVVDTMAATLDARAIAAPAGDVQPPVQ